MAMSMAIAASKARAAPAPSPDPALPAPVPDPVVPSASEPVEPVPSAPEPVEPVPSEPEPVGHARPGEEGGRVDAEEQDSTARVVARGALLVPRFLLEAVLAPVQGSVWVFDRYQLEDRYYDTFYNADRTFGITPTAYYATGLGFTAGLDLISKDTFGKNERLELYGLWGGTYRLRTGGSLDSGTRLGRLALRVDGGFDRLPDDPFFGIGNGDRSPPPASGMLIDPLTNPTAVETFNRYQIGYADASATVTLVDGLAAIGRGSFVDLHYSPSTRHPSIQMVYAPTDLVGFEQGVEQAYVQGELRWDTRAPASSWEPQHLHAVGTYLDGFGGYVRGLDGASSYWRYGFDVQQYLRLAPGPRVLELRLYGEGVTGSVSEVPFSELPHLGGNFLRGYVYDRFRDRVAALATVQYYWDVSTYADIYLFVDAGRVYSSLDDLTFRGFRVGVGPGIEVHSESQFLFEAYLGASIDGDVSVSVAFTPIANRRAHWW